MKITDLKELGQIIKQTRKTTGLSQYELALSAGVGIRSIVELENGSRNTGIKNVIKICNLLGLSLNIN